MNNGSSALQNMSVTAICESRGTYAYRSGAPIAFPTGTQGATTTCFDNQAVGGGVYISGNSASAYVAIMRPFDGLTDDDDRPDDGFSFNVRNDGGAVTYTPTAICRV